MSKEDNKEEAPEQEQSIWRSLGGTLLYLLVIVLLTWVIVTFVGQRTKVDGHSMEPTLSDGDNLIVDKLSYRFRDPEPGDIVTFQDPEIPGRILIKRVIAVGGQTVDLRDGRVYVDGVLQDEPYTRGEPSYPLTPYYGLTIDYPYTVPEGMMWMMGDNRTNSQDSRYFGAVSVASAEARSVAVLWPLGDVGLLG